MKLGRPRAPRTLRGRLVALLGVLLTIGFAAAALITVLVVRHVLIDRLDSQLQAAGDRFSVSLEHDDHDADNGPSRYGGVEGQLAGTLGARLLDGTVTEAAIVGDHDTSDQVPESAKARLRTLTADMTPRSIDLPGLGTYRVIVARGHDNDLQVTGLPAEPVENTIDKLVLIEIAVFAGTLLLVALAATGLVRLMLRPLARVADTASEVSALPLGSGGVSLPHRVSTGTHGSEVDTLSRAFNTMLEQVEAALRTRAASEDQLRRFIADASHELRTPVAVVRSHAELAQRAGAAADGAGSILPDEVVHSLERITAQAGRMGRLVEDLLLLARLDSGRPLAHGDVDIVRVVLDAVDDVRPTAAEHRWRLRLPPHSVWVDGDAHALGQAVANLLANAAAHTPPGTTVTVTVELDGLDSAAETARRVLLAVADDGPGMSEELAARAFDRFVRGDHARGLSRGSSGLGLPIVSAIVAAHNGRITLDSTPAGTTLRVTLPVSDSPDAAGAENDAADFHERSTGR
ncbi:sensor histidine kinase [uncultured Jatrophihabitans sp.]|uniref:sensor histidine kinase n=1 Tax=uncultured Jatrophihabitans sp. TaxID=1610747 RepID=UPI0035CA5C03